MKRLTERHIISIMRQEYSQRLMEAMLEADVLDKRGNILLSPDLKVRHKKSGFEYTVDRVEGEGDNIKIHLRMPEIPRFGPQDSREELVEGEESIDPGAVDVAKLLGDPSPEDPVSLEKDEDEIFIIDREEFEKEYEVS